MCCMGCCIAACARTERGERTGLGIGLASCRWALVFVTNAKPLYAEPGGRANRAVLLRSGERSAQAHPALPVRKNRPQEKGPELQDTNGKDASTEAGAVINGLRLGNTIPADFLAPRRTLRFGRPTPQDARVAYAAGNPAQQVRQPSSPHCPAQAPEPRPMQNRRWSRRHC